MVLFRDNETNNLNETTWLKSQLVGDEQVGYIYKSGLGFELGTTGNKSS